jgi:zinc protease
MKRTAAVLAFILAVGAWWNAAAQQEITSQGPARPANQGNQPTQPGTAQETARRPASAAAAEPWKQIPIPPLPAFHPPVPKRIELANGMVIFLQENHELPLISATARIHGGERDEPAAKAGLVQIFGEVWRTGGTKGKTGDQLDDLLEMRAAKVETDGDMESTSIALNCLKQDFDSVFALFLELLHEPAFREDKIALAKEELRTVISRRNDDIDDIVRREGTALAYGKTNPYARVPEYATVDAITRGDLVQWHQRLVQPNNIVFGVSGDFDAEAMEKQLRQAFESWPKGMAAPVPKIDFAPAAPGLYFAAKEDVNQSAIRMVTLGIERNNPDLFAVEAMNELFAGGFSSRLVKVIRTEKGLAYNVGGGIGAGYDHPGIFRIVMGTKTASTAEATKALNAQIEDLLKVPATAEELKRAKDAILTSFIFRIDTPDKVLAERMTYEFYGYPLDFLEKYRAGIEKVTVEDVNRVAHKYVHPNSFAVLVVGNDEAGKLVSSLGPVTKLDIAIPAAGGQPESTPKPAASNPQGQALIAKVIEGLGGAARVNSIKTLRIKTTVLQKTPQGEVPVQIENTLVFPDRTVQVITTPMGEVKTVVTPSAAFMSQGGQVMDMPAEMRQGAQADIKRDQLFVAQHASAPGYLFSAAGTEKIGTVETFILDISAGGVATRWFVDPQTGHVLRRTYTTSGRRGPVQRTVDSSAWTTTDGLTVPSQATLSENGQPAATIKVEQVEVNPAVDPKIFEKPAKGE